MKRLKDRNQNYIVPITHPDAVIDDNGQSVSARFIDIMTYGETVLGKDLVTATTAFQKLLDDKAGLKICLKSGTYVIDTINMTQDTILEGVGNVIIKANRINVQGIYNAKFKNIIFDFTDSTQTDYFYIYQGHAILFEECTIRSYANKDFNLMKVTRSYYCKVIKCIFNGYPYVDTDGIQKYKGTAISGVLINSSYIHDNHFYQINKDISITNTEQTEIYGNNFEQMSGNAIEVLANATATIDGISYRMTSSNINVHNNRFESGIKDNVLIHYCYFGAGTYQNSFEDNYTDGRNQTINNENMQTIIDLGVQNRIKHNSNSNSRYVSQPIKKKIVNPNSDLRIRHKTSFVPLYVNGMGQWTYNYNPDNTFHMECGNVGGSNNTGFYYSFVAKENTPFCINMRYKGVGRYFIKVRDMSTNYQFFSNVYNDNMTDYKETTFFYAGDNESLSNWKLIKGHTYSVSMYKNVADSDFVSFDIDFIRILNVAFPTEGETIEDNIVDVIGTFDYANYYTDKKVTIVDTANVYIPTGIAGKLWSSNTVVASNDIVYSGNNVYVCTVGGTTGTVAPTHTSGSASDGTATWYYVGNVFKFIKLAGV
jgi:hypothetical protein